MSTATVELRRGTSRAKIAVWGGVIAGIAILAAANIHLVYVAIASQPDCVEHVKPGGEAEGGALSAAKSAC